MGRTDEVVYRRIQDCAWVLRDGELWCIDREAAIRLDGVLWGRGWKANVDTRKYRVIEPPEELVQQTRAAMSHLRADTLALDFLEKENGEFVVLESNDTPGYSGFPEEVRGALVDRLKGRLR